MNMITTNIIATDLGMSYHVPAILDIDKAIALFANSTKGIKQDAIDWITGNKRGIKQARAFIGLSKNNKMPAYTIAIPARESCPRGGKLAKVKGTVCHDCYAVKGHDGMKPAQIAKQRRWDVIQLALASPIIYDLWLSAFSLCMSKESFFRWHSAGDLFSASYVAMVHDAISRTQWVQHWIPTKEPVLARPLLDLVNCAVRLSDDMVNQVKNKFKGLTSGVHTPANGGRGQACPASEKLQDGCQDCRACWSHDVAHVSYKIH
jgi:hypothetical protein